MTNYPQRMAESLLPLSVAGDLSDALEEWYFNENFEDHYAPIATCELCGKEEIRYHFQIENRYSKAILWVGSHCILQFDLAVYEGGERLTPTEAKRKLDKLVDHMRLEACVTALEELAEAENNAILRNALEFYRRKKKLTPKFAFVVFWRLQANKIDHNPSFFSIDLKRAKYAHDLKEMDTSRVHLFWSALTSSQRRRAVEMGHTPPAGQTV